MIDYATWAEKRGIKYTTFSTHQVRLGDILEIAKECNITFQKGDILFVRIGVTKEWDTIMTDTQKQQYSNNPKPEHAGVEATTDVLRWLWDTGFSAIAGDAISWEVYPPQSELFLHEYVLAGWGMPIGESSNSQDRNGLILEYRRALRFGRARTYLSGASAVELLCSFYASEYAGWCLVSTKYDGHLLNASWPGLQTALHIRNYIR